MICAMELIELEHTYAILPNAFHVKMHVYVCIKNFSYCCWHLNSIIRYNFVVQKLNECVKARFIKIK